MTLSMRDTGPQITEIDVLRLERKIKFKLPYDYRTFLLRYNGGRPTPKFFKIVGFASHPIGQILDFFGLGDPVESCRLDWNFDVFSSRMPFGFIPIACEDNGNIICLSLAESSNEAVYYWDHEEEQFPPERRNVYKISDTFQEFLIDLREFP